MTLIIPSPLPDEPAEGLWGRTVRVNGLQPSLAQSVRRRRLLVQQQVCTMADALGMNAFEFARQHTLMPFRHANQNVEDVYYRGAVELPQELRLEVLQLFSIEMPGPARLCLSCVAEDLKHWDISYWHRCHQLPAVVLCPLHDEPLLKVQSTDAINGSPRDCSAEACECSFPLTHSRHRAMLNLYCKLAVATLWRKTLLAESTLRALLLRWLDTGSDWLCCKDLAGLPALAVASYPRWWLEAYFSGHWAAKRPTSIPLMHIFKGTPLRNRTALITLAMTLIWETHGEELKQIFGIRDSDSSPKEMLLRKCA